MRTARSNTFSCLSSAADATATMPRIVFAPARRAFPRESRVRVASSFATSSSSSARTSGNAGGGAANDAAKVAKGSESSSFLRLFPGEPPEPIPARPGLFASSAVVHGFENGFVNPENQSDADDEGEDFGENFSHLSDFSDFSPPPRVGDASTRTASMSSEVDEELGDDAFVARIGSVDFESDACRGDFSPRRFSSAPPSSPSSPPRRTRGPRRRRTPRGTHPRRLRPPRGTR